MFTNETLKKLLTSSADGPVVGTHCQLFGIRDFYSNTDTLVMVNPQTRSDVSLSLGSRLRKLYASDLNRQMHLLVSLGCDCIVSH